MKKLHNFKKWLILEPGEQWKRNYLKGFPKNPEVVKSNAIESQFLKGTKQKTENHNQFHE